MDGTLTRPNLFQRLRAALSPSLTHPAMLQSFRMPDLERWNMPHRSVDMRDWEVALNMAKNLYRPDRAKLMDLYDSLLKDAHLGSTMETRVLRVVRSKYKLVDAQGKARPDLLPLLETQWFEDFLQYLAEATFYGHTLIELGEMRRPGELRQVNRIDPRNVLPYAGVVARRQGEETGYQFREEPLRTYLIEVGRPDDLGLLERVAPVAVVKKYAIGSWSNFVATFGIPARWVKTRGNSSQRVKQLESVMQNMLSSAYAVIQGDEEFGVAPTPTGDPHKVFDDLVARMNSEISKRVLGQDGTTDNKDASGTYGSLKVLQGVAEDRHAADKASASYVINEELLPRLVKLGYPFNGIRFQWDELRDMAPGELVDAVAKLGVVFDIDPKHVEERTGIRILGARRMPGEQAGGDGNPPGNGRQGGDKPAPPKPGEGGDDDDEDGDGNVTAQWPRDTLGSCGVCGGSKDITAENGPDDLTDEERQALYDDLLATGGQFSQSYFSTTSDALVGGFRQAWQGDPFDFTEQPDPVAFTMMEANVYRFSAAKTRALALEINEMARNAKGFDAFKRMVEESGAFGNHHRWLRTEYANAVNSGQQASRYYAQKRMAKDLPLWEYETMEDGRVRPAHAELNKKVFRHNDRIWDTIYPPNGWRCRCSVRPRWEDGTVTPEALNARSAQEFLDRSELKKMEASGHNINRAKLGEVFKLKGAYQTQNKKGLVSIGVKESYGPDAAQQQFGAIMERPLPKALPPAVDVASTKAQVFRGQDAITLKDHVGRPWKFKVETFDHHMVGKKYVSEARYKTAHLVGDVLGAPDEVWLSVEAETGKAKHRFIRYYDGQSVVVETLTELKAGEEPSMRVFTWYEMSEAHSVSNRTGLLLKRNTR